MAGSGRSPDLFGTVDERVRLPREALDAIEWLDGEAIRSVWGAGSGYLVISTLRCAVLGRGDAFGRPGHWYAPAEYLFFNFAEPKVVGLTEVELAEEFFDGREHRVVVADPIAVQTALLEARTEGKMRWALRRAADGPAPTPGSVLSSSRSGARDLPPVPPRSPCSACGNLYASTAQRCPYCQQPRALGPRGRLPRR